MTNFLSLYQECGSKKYNVEPSNILWSNVKKSFNNHIMKCLPCPYEAICEQGIRSKGNYLGVQNQDELNPICLLSYTLLLHFHVTNVMKTDTNVYAANV